MNIAEILRRLAEVLDDLNPEVSDAHKERIAGSMVSPLQQKHELLKKSVDVDNAYQEDDMLGCHASDSEQPSSEDELSVIKRNAGIPIIAIAELSGDNTEVE